MNEGCLRVPYWESPERIHQVAGEFSDNDSEVRCVSHYERIDRKSLPGSAHHFTVCGTCRHHCWRLLVPCPQEET